MSGAWTVRPAGPADADAIIAIEAAAFGRASWGAASIRSGLDAPYVSAFVAEDGEGRTSGFMLWRRIGQEGEILSIAAEAQLRNQGVAKALLAELIIAAEALRLTALFLEVDAGNAPALALYRRAHFEPVGHRRKYYRNGADALVLRRAIEPPI